MSSQYGDNAFDSTLCYGGPLSYVGAQAGHALTELVRVTKPGGCVLLSVMSRLGSAQTYLSRVFDVMDKAGKGVVNDVMMTGDLGADAQESHHCHMFCWSELQSLVTQQSCEIVAASASNFLSVGNQEAVERIRGDDLAWQMFLSWELDCCSEPGAIDGGTHIVVVARRDA